MTYAFYKSGEQSLLVSYKEGRGPLPWLPAVTHSGPSPAAGLSDSPSPSAEAPHSPTGCQLSMQHGHGAVGAGRC